MDIEPRIFLPQEPPPSLDLSQAAKFGILQKPILGRGYQTITSGRIAIETMSFYFQTFSDEDFILPLGDPTVIGISQVLAAHYNEGRYKLLKWHRQEETYYAVSVDLKGSLPR